MPIRCNCKQFKNVKQSKQVPHCSNSATKQQPKDLLYSLSLSQMRARKSICIPYFWRWWVGIIPWYLNFNVSLIKPSLIPGHGWEPSHLDVMLVWFIIHVQNSIIANPWIPCDRFVTVDSHWYGSLGQLAFGVGRPWICAIHMAVNIENVYDGTLYSILHEICTSVGCASFHCDNSITLCGIMWPFTLITQGCFAGIEAIV